METKDRKGYQDWGYETVAKRFSSREQRKHTRISKLDESGELRLYDQNNNLYNTSNEVSKGKYGLVAYAITLDGKLVTRPHIQPGKSIDYGYYHSTLLGGKPGLCFGMMKVKNGKITYIDNGSGHYKPTQENLYNAVKKLNGLFASNAEIVSSLLHRAYVNTEELSYYNNVETVEQFLKRMETKGKDDLTIPERYFKNIRKDNDQYKELLNYKPVLVINGNAKMAVEQSIRKLIGANFGNKPIIGINQEINKTTGKAISKVIISFHNQDIALKFKNKFMECGYKCGAKLQSGDYQYVIRSSEKNFNSFLETQLKIDPKDIKILKNQLTLKGNKDEQKIEKSNVKVTINEFEQKILKEKDKMKKGVGRGM